MISNFEKTNIFFKLAEDEDGLASSRTGELIERIYEEEQDMKQLMKTIVREEKQMEKMLHKLEQCGCNFFTGLNDSSPKS